MRGQVRVHGAPATDGEVVALTSAARFAASAPVGPGGAFELAVPEGARDLLVRVRHPAVVLAVRPLPAGDGELAVDLRPPLFELSGEIVGDRPPAPPLTLFVDPESVDGVPAEVVPLALQKAPAVRSTHYLTLDARDSFSFTVAGGTYRVGGFRVNFDSPTVAPDAPADVAVARAHDPVEGVDYEGEPWGGFAVPVHANTHVTLVLRQVASRER